MKCSERRPGRTWAARSRTPAFAVRPVRNQYPYCCAPDRLQRLHRRRNRQRVCCMAQATGRPASDLRRSTLPCQSPDVQPATTADWPPGSITGFSPRDPDPFSGKFGFRPSGTLYTARSWKILLPEPPSFCPGPPEWRSRRQMPTARERLDAAVHSRGSHSDHRPGGARQPDFLPVRTGRFGGTAISRRGNWQFAGFSEGTRDSVRDPVGGCGIRFGTRRSNRPVLRFPLDGFR